MDQPFDPKLSTSSHILTCGTNKKCFIRQSYSEGSSWNAIKVKDFVSIGGNYKY